MHMPSIRITYFSCLILVALLLGMGFYLQVVDGMTPCPLCILQRFTMALLGIVFFLGAAAKMNKIGNFFLGLLTSAISLLGIFLSGRQVWLQHLPADSNADCGVSLQYLMQALPFDQAIRKILQGTAECSQTGAQYLGLSIAEWSLVWFVIFFVIGCVQMMRKKI